MHESINELEEIFPLQLLGVTHHEFVLDYGMQTNWFQIIEDVFDIDLRMLRREVLIADDFKCVRVAVQRPSNTALLFLDVHLHLDFGDDPLDGKDVNIAEFMNRVPLDSHSHMLKTNGIEVMK